jgi:hypothetical protein
MASSPPGGKAHPNFYKVGRQSLRFIAFRDIPLESNAGVRCVSSRLCWRPFDMLMHSIEIGRELVVRLNLSKYKDKLQGTKLHYALHAARSH